MSDGTGHPTSRPTGAPCAICGKPALEAFKPFCSKRCADVDLQRWLSGRYAIPVDDEPDDPDDAGGPGG